MGELLAHLLTYLGLTETQDIILDDDDLSTYNQTMNDIDKDEWVQAMNLEMKFMYFNSVSGLVDQHNEVKPKSCKWIYKTKTSIDGKVKISKARLMAKYYLCLGSRLWRYFLNCCHE